MSVNDRELIIAAGDGNYNLLEHYIKEGADVNFKDRDGNTALHWAIESSDLKGIELLLHNGAKNLENNGNETPLFLANVLRTWKPPLPLQSALHVITTDYDRKDQHNINPVVPDTNHGCVETVTQMLSHGGNVETRNDTQMDALYQHEKRGSSEEGEQFFEQAKRGISVLFNIRNPVKSFTGRTSELHKLHNMLQDGSEMTQIACICGLGGVGKTELARKYITVYSENYDNNILWINAECYKSLAASFRILAANKLNICTKNANGQEKEVRSVVEEVYMYFTKQSSLFVFDNAEKYSSQNEFDGLEKFLPSVPFNGNTLHVLITSRNKKWPKHVKVLQLDVFDKSEAIDFLKNSLEIEENISTSKLTDLATLLGFMPLALQQAVSYISVHDEHKRILESKFTIEDYILAYQEKDKEYLNFNLSEHNDNDYSRTMYTTWNVTLEMLSQMEGGNNALEILNIVSYLAPEDIPTHLFSGLLTDPAQLGFAISLLSQYSLINIENAKFNIHRLVQEIIRMKIQEQNLEVHVLRAAFCLFNKDNVTHTTLLHAVAIWNHSHKYNDLVIEFCPISSLVSCVLLMSARYEEAYLFGLNVLKSLITLPENHAQVFVMVVATQGNIAMALLEQDKYDKALQILQSILQIKKYFRFDLDDIMYTQYHISTVFTRQGNHSQALQCLQDVYACKNTLGSDHRVIISAKIGMATILKEQGEHAKAVEKLKEICQDHEQVLGKSNSTILECKLLLAGSLMELRQYDEALVLLLETYKTNVQTDESRSTMFTIMGNIATSYFMKRDFDKALQWYNDQINAEVTVHGKETPSVLRSRSFIADVLQYQGKCSKALKICREVLEKQKDIFGPEHDDTITTQATLSKIYLKRGEINKAMEILEEVLQKRRIIYHSSHPEVLQTLKFIVKILDEHHRFNEAFEYNQQVLDIQVKTLGKNDIDTLSTKVTSGIQLYNQKGHDKALKIFQDTFDTLKRLYPHDSVTQSAKEYIGLVYIEREKYEDALTIFREVLHAREGIFGKDHIETVATNTNIAHVLLRQGKSREALKLLRELHAVDNDALGPQSRNTLEAAACIEGIMKLNNDLSIAVRNNDAMAVLHAFGGDVNSANTDKGSLLHYAVNNDNSFIVHTLLKGGADIMHVTGKGNTPLHIAVSKGLSDITSILLEHATSHESTTFVDVQTTISGSSALHIAAKNGSLKIVQKLLAHGATYNLKTKEGNTPLMLSKNRNIVELLLLTDELFQNAKSGNTTCIRKLQRLSYGSLLAVTNARNESKTALQVSIVNKQKKFTKVLIQLLQETRTRLGTE